MAYSPQQPQTQTGSTNATFWLAVFAFVINLGIAIQLVFGLISISVLRSRVEAQPPPAVNAPAPEAPNTPNANESLTDRVLNNMSGVVSRGLATFVLFVIVFVLAIIVLRFVPNGSGQSLAQWMGWAYIVLATGLWLAALWRFSSAADLALTEYLAYLGIGVLMIVCALVLSIVVRQSRMRAGSPSRWPWSAACRCW
ncbi:MAG: hypothetical protein HC853_14130 [Anaerolineae bacterium]|nr:hypothetical protein [Anaerolineae bacterium]